MSDWVTWLKALFVTEPEKTTQQPKPAGQGTTARPQRQDRAHSASPPPVQRPTIQRPSKVQPAPTPKPAPAAHRAAPASGVVVATRGKPGGGPAKRKLPRRRYHLGLDWGTSTTKMVLRDYDAPGSRFGYGNGYVLEPGGKGARYPSTVVLEGGRLYFGWEAMARRASAERRWDSLKAEAALGRGWSRDTEVEGVTFGDLALLSLAHMVAVATREAEQLAGWLDAQAVMGMTLTVPVEHLQVRHREYLSTAAPAYRLGNKQGWDPQGRSLLECQLKIAEIREQVLPQLDYSAEAADRWLRAEVVAAMLWPFWSPEVEPGPYTVIDIGAATTNASFFRINTDVDPSSGVRSKSSMDFFGAATRTPGMDRFDEALAQVLGLSDPVQVRGEESRHLQRAGAREAVDPVVSEFHETWAKARQDVWKRGGGGRLSHWEGLNILVVGGGSKVGHIQRRFEKPPGYFEHNLHRYGMLPSPGRPDDLFRMPGSKSEAMSPRPYHGDHAFHMVAYGVSFHTSDLPIISLPDEQPPFQHVRFDRGFVDSWEMGYDNP